MGLKLTLHSRAKCSQLSFCLSYNSIFFIIQVAQVAQESFFDFFLLYPPKQSSSISVLAVASKNIQNLSTLCHLHSVTLLQAPHLFSGLLQHPLTQFPCSASALALLQSILTREIFQNVNVIFSIQKLQCLLNLFRIKTSLLWPTRPCVIQFPIPFGVYSVCFVMHLLCCSRLLVFSVLQSYQVYFRLEIYAFAIFSAWEALLPDIHMNDSSCLKVTSEWPPLRTLFQIIPSILVVYLPFLFYFFCSIYQLLVEDMFYLITLFIVFLSSLHEG